MPKLDDQQVRRLLLRTAAREAAAFEQLYRLTAPVLLAIAMRVVGRRELAEEVLHDTFVKIWRSAHLFDPLSPSPMAWMASVARHRAIDTISSSEAQRTVTDSNLMDLLADCIGSEEPGGQADAESGQQARHVRECIDALAAPERQSLVLAYYHGLSHGELATHLQKPLGTVKGWVRRGLANLRTCVEACIGSTA